ncbi:serine/threonine-protein kinase/endoribonuclease ire-1-like [Branchiostoma floridae]|uniref:Serine/threonine-protein kinase/endoribonuclease ire-1-like n=1 Tax=Branchiostoma floridae TaxID=7739 RepID=A0A9J7MR57_BRAFL|nr:serine/threonine-protein kinase/endoribonuclease ire-1-like [Branchiostoma floridae]
MLHHNIHKLRPWQIEREKQVTKKGKVHDSTEESTNFTVIGTNTDHTKWWKSATWGSKLKELSSMKSEQCKIVGPLRMCTDKEFCLRTDKREGINTYLGIMDGKGAVAVKQFDRTNADSVRKCKQELSILAIQGNREHIIRHYHYAREKMYRYLALELPEHTLQEYVQLLKEQNELHSKARLIIHQIVEGLQSLHEGPRPILHRDLCPANVVLNAKLCVKLTGFGNSNILQKEVPIQDYNEGTPCWKAKESLCYSTCSKESDIQATGMLVYFVLSGGLHPYGELDQPHIVEENIKMGQPTGLPLIDDQEARDMIEWMLEDNSAYRPDVNQILNHPFLEQWNNGKRMEFLERVGNQPEVASGKDNSSTLWAINNKCNKTCTCVGDWKNKVDEKLLTESTRPYNQSVGDLLRLIRNVRQHYQELSEELQELVDDKYFLRLFPSLVVHIYKILRKRALADGSWAKRKSLQRYFIPKS